MTLALVLLTGIVVTLMVVKVTRWYELLVLGGWGILIGAALSGTASFSGMSLDKLWNVIF